jgi:hypothetical protein
MDPTLIPILLILTQVMVGQQPDKSRFLTMPTIDECFSQARDWDNQTITEKMRAQGVVALRSACQVKDLPKT